MDLARISLIASALLLLETGSVCAHPIPKDTHDRFITVRLQEGSMPGLVRVIIVYRLEVDEFTVVTQDMRDYRDQVDAGLFANKPLAYYAQYARIYTDIIGRNLRVQVNGTVVPLIAGKRSQTLKDEATNEALGHLRCLFEYSAEFPVKKDDENLIQVRESNFRDLDGQIHFFFVNQAGFLIERKVVPDGELNKLHPLERPRDFDAKIRNLSVGFVPVQLAGTEIRPVDACTRLQKGWLPDPDRKIEDKSSKNDIAMQPKGEGPAMAAEVMTPHTHGEHEDHDVFLQTYRRLRESNAGIWLILLVFAGLGAAHALTPGHGKTLVAAYLVGEHGTIWHAVVLGLVTTITHTGVVLIIAFVLFFLPETMSAQARQTIQTGLGLVLGLSVTCLGFWLLLQRLSGRADHIHLGGGHDHHHHHGPAPAPASAKPIGMGGIIVMGMNGGLIPCWDAVAILATVAGTREFWLALPALLAFSAGLAGVLVAIGIMVVQFRNFAGSKWGEGKIVRLLPLLSAVIVTCMGIYLCYASLPRNVR